MLAPDPRWVASTFALIEEQVERYLKKDILYELAASRLSGRLSLLMPIAFLMVIALLLLDKGHELRNHMWLSSTDMTEINTQLSDPAPPHSGSISRRRQTPTEKRSASILDKSVPIFMATFLYPRPNPTNSCITVLPGQVLLSISHLFMG